MRGIRRAAAVTASIVMATSTLFGQTDPKNVPKPPSVELSKLSPFLGTYSITAQYAGASWSGTMTIEAVIKGWYVERTILVTTEGIDREFHSMITFDRNAQQYRIWRFETFPAGHNEGTGRFDGDQFIEEYSSGDGSILRNLNAIVSANELRIVTEVQEADGKIEQVGITTAKRVN